MLSSPWRSLRRRILTPGVSNTKISVRGFHEKNPEATELLETVGRSFLEGYAFAAEATIGEVCQVLRDEWGTHDALRTHS